MTERLIYFIYKTLKIIDKKKYKNTKDGVSFCVRREYIDIFLFEPFLKTKTNDQR